MKTGSVGRVIILSAIFIVLYSASTFAADITIVREQGKVISLDLTKKMTVINEKVVIWDQSTLLMDSMGAAVTIDKVKPGNWVFIEGEYDNIHKRVWAKKIYLLPKYIQKKERYRYSFFQ